MQQELLYFLGGLGEKITSTTKYVITQGEMFLLIWGLLTLLYMYYLNEKYSKNCV